MQQYIKLLNEFEPIELRKLDAVKLLNRTDKKYILTLNHLADICYKLIDNYYVLQIENARNCSYSTIYFDTDDLKLYTQHHNGKLNRFKVRARRYEDSNTNFFELKFKSNKGKTQKKRLQTNSFVDTLDKKRINFVLRNSNVIADSLSPKIYVKYNRVTLVSKQMNERLTIDTNMGFNYDNRNVRFDNIAIIEIKRDINSNSFAENTLHDFRIKPLSISKYCLGIASLYHNVKTNNFKSKFYYINKLNHETV